MAIYNESMAGGLNVKDCTADASKILEGYTAGVGKEIVTGSMPDNGWVDTAIVDGTLLEGYTSGGTIANLSAENICKDIEVCGIKGTAEKVPTWSLISCASGLSISETNHEYVEIAVANNGSMVCAANNTYYSPDGKTWQKVSTNVSDVGRAAWSAQYGFIVFSIAAKGDGSSSSITNEYGISANGTSWKRKTVSTGCRFNDVHANDSYVVAFGGYYSGKYQNNAVYYSSNGGQSFSVVSFESPSWRYNNHAQCIYNDNLQKWFFVSGTSTYGLRVDTCSNGAFSTFATPYATDSSDHAPYYIASVDNYVIAASNVSTSNQLNFFNASGRSKLISTGTDAVILFFKYNNKFYYLTSAGDLYQATSITGTYSLYKQYGISIKAAAFSKVNSLISIITETASYYMLLD